MSKIFWNLQQKEERLKHEVLNNFDFLVGSVTTQGANVQIFRGLLASLYIDP